MQQVAPNRLYGLSAQGKPLSVKARHGPKKKGKPHTQGFAAAHSPITDHSVMFPVLLPAPPKQQTLLLGRKVSDLHGP